ncbi:MAG: MarR family transcriptional regulator [Bacteroidia bacterium]|nr:MarR family transcriptional regulator [Bacteroidia bacterium]
MTKLLYLATVVKFTTIMQDLPVRKFRRILRNFERELNSQNQSGCCCGVTITQCHTLMALDQKDNITLNELAELVCLDKSTVSRTVDNLFKSQLIDRTIPESNRRTTLITLTQKGKETCRTINSGNDFYYRQVFASIPADLIAPFLQGFEILANSMALQNHSARS